MTSEAHENNSAPEVASPATPPRRRSDHTAPRPPVADELVNSFRITGSVEEIDLRAKSGAIMIVIRTSSVPDRPINGAPVPSWFTPVMPVRIPPQLAETLPRSMLRKGRSIVTIEGRLQGLRRTLNTENEGERDFWFVEAVAREVKLLFSQGRVFGRERAEHDHEDSAAESSESAGGHGAEAAPTG